MRSFLFVFIGTLFGYYSRASILQHLAVRSQRNSVVPFFVLGASAFSDELCFRCWYFSTSLSIFSFALPFSLFLSCLFFIVSPLAFPVAFSCNVSLACFLSLCPFYVMSLRHCFLVLLVKCQAMLLFVSFLSISLVRSNVVHASFIVPFVVVIFACSLLVVAFVYIVFIVLA